MNHLDSEGIEIKLRNRAEIWKCAHAEIFSGLVNFIIIIIILLFIYHSFCECLYECLFCKFVSMNIVYEYNDNLEIDFDLCCCST